VPEHAQKKATSMKQQEKQPPDAEDQGRQQRQSVIRGHVLRALGPPDALHRVDIRRLWEDHYRVNIFVGPDGASARVAHSYFLVTDGNGNILASTPKIRREYSLAEGLRPLPAFATAHETH